MNAPSVPISQRLQAELLRLFPSPPSTGTGPDSVRFLVIGVAAPADWPTLASVWRGVQTDWDWPAPAIAVNGVDAFELWVPLQGATPRDEARALLRAMCARYLGDVRPARWRLWPALDDGLCVPPQALPQQQAATGRWSAFVAPDLAAVFGDDPSLDMPPGDDAQADVLSHIRSVTPQDWRRGVAWLVGANPHGLAQPMPGALTDRDLASHEMAASVARPIRPDFEDDPRRFLLDVMNNPGVDLALRIEAAKALLR